MFDRPFGAWDVVAITGTSGCPTLPLPADPPRIDSPARLRLERIREAVETLPRGGFEARVPVGTRDDAVDRLARSINAALERTARMTEDLRQVSADLAHDLRTPLGRLRTCLEAVMDEEDPRCLRDGVGRALHHSDDLLSLLSGILRIAEVERGDLRAGFLRMDLATLAEDMAEAYAPAVEDGGRAFEFVAHGPVQVLGDRALVAQAVANLLDNAQLHTPTGTRIVLRASTSGATGRLEVLDDGPGVPAADRARVVQRHVRLDRSHGTPGHGLGLSMVAAVAAAHHGRLDLLDAAPGLRAVMSFPVVAPTASGRQVAETPSPGPTLH